MDNAPTYARPADDYGPPWMSEDEYLFSLRDVPDEILDAAPADEIPEELWLARVTAEAALLPDPLTDVPGVPLADWLADGINTECRDGSLIDRITGFERQASWAAAGQARAIAELAKRRVEAGGTRELAFFVDEVALALTCTRQAAWTKVHTALDLVDRLPDTLTSLADGRIGATRARIIAEGTRALNDANARLVQADVLAAAEVLTPSKLRLRVAAAITPARPRTRWRLHPTHLRQPPRRHRPQHPAPHRSDQRGQPAVRCRHDHHLKQHPQWAVRAGPDGRIHWIAPNRAQLPRTLSRPPARPHHPAEN